VTAAARWNAVGQTEFTLARAVVLFRVAGLVEAVIVAGHNASDYRHGVTGSVLLAAAVATESAILGTACVRARQVRPWWTIADLAFTIAVLVISAMIETPQGGLYVAYPFSVICSLAFGLGLRRLSSVLAATVLLAAGYLYGGGHLHADPATHVVVNTITYFPNTIIAWMVAEWLRRMGRELDASRAREASLARNQERLRHARMLHDRVLQTMETLAGGQWITDSALRARVAEEAVWLRGLVEGTDVEGADKVPGGDLLGQLGELVARAARDGLHVELNHATLRGPAALSSLGSRQSAALTGAISEALTNVVKHAATATAVLRLTATPAALVVTLVDQGRGFDPATQPEGMGLRQSIRGRITESGGTVRIDTAPGAGTYLEITMPLASGPARCPSDEASLMDQRRAAGRVC
jgi:signal transduction histidine kinase